MSQHWTERSTEDFVYKIASDFALQIENKMDEDNITQASLADQLRVSPGRVSQVLRNPGNLTIKKIVEYARTLGMKVSIVAYEDGDPQNQNGPINSQIFNACWARAGKPNIFFIENSSVVSNSPMIKYVQHVDPQRESYTSHEWLIGSFGPQSKKNTGSEIIVSGG